MIKANTSKASLITMIILTIVIIAGAVGGIAYATNGLTTDLRGFDVYNDGKLVDGNTYVLKNDNTPVEFEIKKKMPNLDLKNLTYKIIANKNASSVRIKLNEKIKYSLSYCKDFAPMFDIKIDNDKITISTDWNLVEFLKNYYNSPIELQGFESGKKAYFDIIFSIGKSSVCCSFLEYIGIDNIELDKDSVLLE